VLSKQTGSLVYVDKHREDADRWCSWWSKI